jgi:hypothetical protein
MEPPEVLAIHAVPHLKMTACCEISPASSAGVDDLDRIDAERPRTLMKAAGMASAA